MPAALALFAHPDDIEFVAAGTLLLLAQAGFDLHYMTVASGNCGSADLPPDEIARIRRAESLRAAEILGATYHPPVANDLEITYDISLLRKLAAVVREVRPQIVLTHSPEDYMEDHMCTSRLAVTAAFTRCIPNFKSDPDMATHTGDVAVYHAMPHGLCNGLRQGISPHFYIGTTSVHATKSRALTAHESQREWLDQTQRMGSYLAAMDEMSKEVGKMSGSSEHAEGWRRHAHLGFAPEDFDPLARRLSEYHHKPDTLWPQSL